MLRYSIDPAGGLGTAANAPEGVTHLIGGSVSVAKVDGIIQSVVVTLVLDDAATGHGVHS